MKKSSIKRYINICLILFTMAGISYAGDRDWVIEMADGHIITFPISAEKKALYEGAMGSRERRLSETVVRSNKKSLVFEMAESGITISFPLTEAELAAERTKDFVRAAPLSNQSRHAKPKIVKFELAESGIYIIFPVVQDDNDQKKDNNYSQNRLKN